MTTVIGNESVVSSLYSEFPPISVLLGPSSVGKRTVSEYVCLSKGILESDILSIKRLGMFEARTAVDFLSTASVGSKGRAVIARVDGSSYRALDVLLKILEEPEENTHVLLLSSEELPFTTTSRASVYRFGILTTAQVSLVLQKVRNLSEAQADRLAEMSGGQLSTALHLLGAHVDKALVLAAVRSLREKDLDGLELLVDRWRDEHTSLLTQWAYEAASKRWRRFNSNETGEVGRLPLLLLLALRPKVRASLVVNGILFDLIRDKEGIPW